MAGLMARHPTAANERNRTTITDRQDRVNQHVSRGASWHRSTSRCRKNIKSVLSAEEHSMPLLTRRMKALWQPQRMPD